MVEYRVFHEHPHRKFIQFEAVFPNTPGQSLQLQLPSWRPGRYELGNFAKNIRSFEAFDEKNQKLTTRKITKDLWEIQASDNTKITIQYHYYCAELNAGSSYTDTHLLYMNPVNCFFYNKANHSTRINCMLEPKRLLPTTKKSYASYHNNGTKTTTIL